MKKLLTIVALGLILCLGISAALAVSGDVLTEDQQDCFGWLPPSEVVITAPGRWVWSDEDGNHNAGQYWLYDKNDCDHEYVTIYYYVSGNNNVTIAENEVDDYSCKYNVYSQNICYRCGDKKKAVLLDEAGHDWEELGYDLKDPTKAGYAAPEDWYLPANANAADIQEKICTDEDNAGKKIYLVKFCATCGKYTGSSVGEIKGDHTWASAGKSTETIEDILKWAKVERTPTCTHTGWAVDYCTKPNCTATRGGWDIPTVAHKYTNKVYSYAYDKLPNCQNGMTATYKLGCEWVDECGKFEGGVTWAKANPYTEKITTEEAIKLDLVHDDWFNYNQGWLEGILNRDRWYEENHDDAGHFYVVLSDEEWYDYPCVANASVQMACVWCGKTKIVSTGNEKDTPMYDIILDPVYVNCYTMKCTKRCSGCLGEVHPDLKDQVITLQDGDVLAHHDFWTEDISKRVPATCTQDGSKTFYCAIHTNITKTEKIAATGHLWGPYTVKTEGKDRTIYEATCIACKTAKNYVTIWNTENPDNTEVAQKWVAGTTTPGTCLTPSKTTYTLKNADGDKIDEVTVEGAFGDHIMEVVKEAHKEPTCTEPGIDLTICVTCTNYQPLTEAQKKDLKHDYSIVDDLKAKGAKPVFSYVETPATGHKVETWTEKDGKLEGTCTVCKQTVTKDKPMGEAAYTLSDVKFANGILSGKLNHTAGTKEAEKLSIRVTFFTAGNNYMTTTATIYADGTFEAEGAGDIEAITLVAYATDKVVNPTDVANQTKLDAKEIVVK